MHIKQLNLLNFRNHVDFNSGEVGRIISLVGDNGCGKTSILEAISMFSPGQGLHHVGAEQMLCQTQNIYREWSVRAVLTDERQLTVAATIGERSSKRHCLLEETRLSNQKELLQLLRVIWLTPKMDYVFAADSVVRRRFLDRMTYNIHPEHAINVVKYQYFMRSRLKFLASDRPDELFLTQLESKMAQYAALINQLRLQTIEALSQACQYYASRFLAPIISLSGVVSTDHQEMCSHWRHCRNMDRAKIRTHFGPHRTDLIAMHPAKKLPATMCSTGEQKAMLVALLLAQAYEVYSHCRQHPVVLLDEPFTHLDGKMVHELLLLLELMEAQIWLTSTTSHPHIKNNQTINLQSK